MCKFNMMCPAKEGQCSCCGPEMIYPQPVRPGLLSPSSDTTLLYHLFSMVNQQNEIIRTLAEQTVSALKKVELLSKSLDSSSSISEFKSSVYIEETATSDHILNFLCGPKSSHLYTLRLVSQLPSPAYKERAFSLMFEIVDRNGTKVEISVPVNFKLMIFNTENPPKVLKVNTSGDKIIRGTVEVETNGVVLFKKVVIKEVTSHFRNGCFFLVVMPKNSQEIRPFIIENFIVKARKIITPECNKKQKQELISTDLQSAMPAASIPNSDSIESIESFDSPKSCNPSPATSTIDDLNADN